MGQKEDLGTWHDLPWWSNTIKILPSAKLIYKYNIIPIKIAAHFFLELGKLGLKFIQRNKQARIDQKTLKKRSNMDVLDRKNTIIINFKVY
jgi:hypothetical protein